MRSGNLFVFYFRMWKSVVLTIILLANLQNITRWHRRSGGRIAMNGSGGWWSWTTMLFVHSKQNKDKMKVYKRRRLWGRKTMEGMVNNWYTNFVACGFGFAAMRFELHLRRSLNPWVHRSEICTQRKHLCGSWGSEGIYFFLFFFNSGQNSEDQYIYFFHIGSSSLDVHCWYLGLGLWGRQKVDWKKKKTREGDQIKLARRRETERLKWQFFSWKSPYWVTCALNGWKLSELRKVTYGDYTKKGSRVKVKKNNF